MANYKTTQAIQDIKNYVEPYLEIKLKGLTRKELMAISDELFAEYNDLFGIRIDRLIAIMEENEFGVVP
jgi:hypothetical protein